ncbi:hypothetical protein A0126_15535 [Exiguobacterium sp. N4-1P]|nr:hypothetical protein A0126_15535 [Exiguobacterium sp. N4-1P]
MASSEGNYHRRGPYFDGTNFANWKHKMKMHILGHNPAVWDIVCIGAVVPYCCGLSWGPGEGGDSQRSP